MADNVHELRPKTGSETEKITINLGYVDLGHIDLLVQDGFYSNRTDFIRTAIRNQIERHADATRQSVARKSLDLGLRHFSRADLEAARAAGQRLDIRVLGLATIAADVTPELAQATIASISVLGALQASAAGQAALADRTRSSAQAAPPSADCRPASARQPTASTIGIPRRDAERASLRGRLACVRALKAPDMNAILPNHMLEATRLTREGRLTEASALLQRLFRGEEPADTAATTPQDTAGPAAGRLPRIIDVDPETGEASDPASAPAAAAPCTTAAGRWPAGGLDK